MDIPFLLQIIGLFVVPLLVVLIPILIGQRYGIYRIRKNGEEQQTAIGSVVGAALGLLAFMLAFTFQIASNRYEARKQLLLESATTIRTTYMRAGLIPEPFRSRSRKLLVEYADIRVGFANDPNTLGIALPRSQAILDTLWTFAEVLAAQDRSSEAYALYTSSINDLVEIFNQRISIAIDYRIPVTILWALFFITVASMFVLGYQFGISGKGGLVISFLFATTFAMVMLLVFALDRPEIGLIRIDGKPFIHLQQQLKEREGKLQQMDPGKVAE